MLIILFIHTLLLILRVDCDIIWSDNMDSAASVVSNGWTFSPVCVGCIWDCLSQGCQYCPDSDICIYIRQQSGTMFMTKYNIDTTNYQNIKLSYGITPYYDSQPQLNDNCIVYYSIDGIEFQQIASYNNNNITYSNQTWSLNDNATNITTLAISFSIQTNNHLDCYIDNVIVSGSLLNTPSPIDMDCSNTENIIKELNWDTIMTNESDGSPNVSFNISFDLTSLSLSFDIYLEYIGLASSSLTNHYKLGTTYVVDFYSFGVNGNKINQPGNCQNRLSQSFIDITDFNQFWTFSQYPYLSGQIGTNQYLSYPPPSNKWTLTASSCNTINYRSTFSWNDLVLCKDYNGNDLININDDGKSIKLSGTLYVNLVSPYTMTSIDIGYYRSLPLIQQDFTISILKQINVISSTGVDLFIISIIGIVETLDGSCELSVLTQSADYIKLINGNALSTPLGLASMNVITNECLVASSFTCGQIFSIIINSSLINCTALSPADFSGEYNLEFQVECRDNQDSSACNAFIDDNNGEIIALDVTANFIDRTCDTKLYQVEFDGNTQFYDDEEFLIPHNSQNGIDDYVIGVDFIYVQVTANFPDDGASSDAYDILGVVINNVFVCTADDDVDLLLNLNQQNGDGGCLSSDIDADGPYNIIINSVENDDYFVNIISAQDGTSNIVQFAFLAFDTPRTIIYVHTQLTVILTSGERRRLQVITSGDQSPNTNFLADGSTQMRHFIDSTGIMPLITTTQLPDSLEKTLFHDMQSNDEMDIAMIIAWIIMSLMIICCISLMIWMTLKSKFKNINKERGM